MTITKLATPLLVAMTIAAPTSTPARAQTTDAAKKPSKAEIGEMLKKCSDEADAKGLTIQKGKGEARKAYRRSCMLKNGIAPKK